MFLYLYQKKAMLKKIRSDGKKLIINKKTIFLSFRFNLILNFEIINESIKKNGINNTICFNKKTKGYFMWFNNIESPCKKSPELR